MVQNYPKRAKRLKLFQNDSKIIQNTQFAQRIKICPKLLKTCLKLQKLLEMTQKLFQID